MSNTGIDIEHVRETYERKTDQELIRVLTTNAHGLTPEALDIVKAEIKKRKLDPAITKAVDAQQKTFTIAEIDAYCAIIQKLPCPISGSTSERLNATLTAEVMSFIIFTRYTKKLIIGNPDALDKANNSALTTTSLLGWWGFPWGIIRSIQAINLNLKNKKANRLDVPSPYLRQFVLANVGYIETYKGNTEKLSELLIHAMN